jgi:hypothetical protein
MQYVEPQDIKEGDNINEYASDTRPGASRRWVIFGEVQRQLPKTENIFMLAENEMAFEEKQPCFDRPPFPGYLLFGPER